MYPRECHILLITLLLIVNTEAARNEATIQMWQGGDRQLPSIVSFFYLETGDVFCQGSLIAADWVATLATCFCPSRDCSPVFNFTVIFGHPNVSGDSSRRQPIQLVINPLFDGTPYVGNLALVRLNRGVDSGSSANVISVGDGAGLVCPGTAVSVHGWGANSSGIIQQREVKFSIKPDKEISMLFPIPCSSSYDCIPGGFGGFPVSGAGQVCGTDLGGPVTVGSTVSSTGTVLVGLLSAMADPSCANQSGAAFFVQLSLYLDFIKKFVSASIGFGTAGGTCGDGKVSGSEGCDDSNTVSGDGCSADCKVEAGFTCSATNDPLCSPSRCSTIAVNIAAPVPLAPVLSAMTIVGTVQINPPNLPSPVQIRSAMALGYNQSESNVVISNLQLGADQKITAPFTICCIPVGEYNNVFASLANSNSLPNVLAIIGVASVSLTVAGITPKASLNSVGEPKDTTISLSSPAPAAPTQSSITAVDTQHNDNKSTSVVIGSVIASVLGCCLLIILAMVFMCACKMKAKGNGSQFDFQVPSNASIEEKSDSLSLGAALSGLLPVRVLQRGNPIPSDQTQPANRFNSPIYYQANHDIAGNGVAPPIFAPLDKMLAFPPQFSSSFTPVTQVGSNEY